MAAKQLSMRTKIDVAVQETPLAQVRVSQILETIRRELGLTYKTMGKLGGVGLATLHDWTKGAPVEQAEAVLRLLSRLPAAARNSTLDAACPIMASIEHPCIARDRLL